MELRQLEMLYAVAEQKGYVRAGEYLHLSHSAIHRQIRLLEEELGQKLFMRRGRGVHLTEAGQLLAGFAARIQQEFKAVEQQVRDMGDVLTGELRVGAGTTALILFLPTVLEEYRRSCPGVDVRIVTGAADQILGEIQKGNLDVGLTSEPPAGLPIEKDLHYERLYDEEFQVVVSKSHPLAGRDHLEWSELRDVPLIAFTRNSRLRRLIDRLFVAAGVVPKIAMELENEEAVEKMIDIGFGAGFLARRRVSLDNLHCMPVGDVPIVLSVAAVRNQGYVPRRVDEFLHICRSHSDLYPR